MSQIHSSFGCLHEEKYLIVSSSKLNLIFCENCIKNKKLSSDDKIFLISTGEEVKIENL